MTKKSDSTKKAASQKKQDAKGGNVPGDNFDLSGDFRGAVVNIKSTVVSDTDDNVRLQNLRDFTVQILRVDNSANVGTGIAVSTDGKIVTCAHVVQAAGIDPRSPNGAEIGVYFPQVRGGEEKNRRATVVQFFAEHEDDIVLLQLTGGASPLAPEQIAVIGNTRELRSLKFESFGYRSFGGDFLGKQIVGVPAQGVILGAVELMEENKFHKEPLMLESNQLTTGMGGAGVLDIKDNLIVGIVSHINISDGSSRDQNTAFGVDARVLPLPPFDLPFRTEPLPLRPAPQPKTDEQTKKQVIQAAQETVEQRTIEEKYAWNSAPSVLNEWTGRDDLLKQITDDWNDPKKHVVGLIGFGGEGKSSLARKWVADVVARSEATKQSPTREGIASQSALATTLDGVFWWGFYENRSVDEFLEAALKYMSGGRIDPRQVQSSNLRAQIIGAMLGAGRYLFVLDGLEVMQHQDGDQYGLLQSNDLRDLLTFFARPDNQSFCLITSRAPLLDLMDYTTYTHRDVDRLSEDDGRALLRRLGVKGIDAELNKVVSDWDGHALTLSILAAYLAERFDGDIHHLADIPVPTADEPRYERVHRVLRRYDEHLTKDEREFLKLFSVFRLPVQESAFEKVFEPLLKSLDKESLLQLVARLATYRLIRHDENEKSYTTHPLIRNHYFAIFTKGDLSQGKAAHEQIKDYYLSIAGDTPQFPTLDDLKPLIEVVHHTCQAGAYDDAFQIYWERILQRDNRVLIYQLGAQDTDLKVMLEFLTNGDEIVEPQTNESGNNHFILNEIGYCLMILGSLRESVPFYERAAKGYLFDENWGSASIIYNNLADLHVHLGALEASAEAAHQALELASRSEDKQAKYCSYCFFARTYYMLGDIENSKVLFDKGMKFYKELYPSQKYLVVKFGVWLVDFLRKTRKKDEAFSVGKENLDYCIRSHQAFLVAQCYRVLGDLDFDSGNPESARAHYESALKIARSISHRPSLIEALLAHGRWQAKHVKDSNTAFSDLNEVLRYCAESGYRIYEADARVALSWAYLANGEKDKAKQSAERALQMSNEMGYYWGKVDAEEVLERMKAEG